MASHTIYPAAQLCADFISKSLTSSEHTQRPLFVGFQGPQGSGKTTLTSQIKTVLGTLPTPIHAIVFSIDDLYLPYEGLVRLGQANPDNALLQGRGLPGTHDPVLGADILERLSRINGESDGLVSLPTFDKSAYRGFGDRSRETVEVRPPVDVVILEGWCFGFQPLSLAELEKRYNGRPETEGGAESKRASFTWFNHEKLTVCVVNGEQIVPENLYDVFNWRLQQEHAMKLKNGGHGMTDEEVHNFVARYMPGYELFQDTIESRSNPWIGYGLKVVLDKQRVVIRTEEF
ncbi:unnamed protein product [Rhizoctonia solani]|uniref:P-loop containing nucleoside triphosphate hydrolase protein n=1 Tax=Rhizoctonia solani TaxID=456999 RepID=A0A8H2XTZ9_9AGAM|nr:unnamed protein product [Rhizoctonia solani]